MFNLILFLGLVLLLTRFLVKESKKENVIIEKELVKSEDQAPDSNLENDVIEKKPELEVKENALSEELLEDKKAEKKKINKKSKKKSIKKKVK